MSSKFYPFFLLLLSVLLGSCTLQTEPASKPNVLVILIDDQGYADMSLHGHPVLKTPNIDKLGRESIRLTDFHSAPYCTPTRSQLMAGRDALDNRACFVNAGRSLIKEGIKLMPQVFADNGYATGIFGKWHLGDSYPHRPMDQGFQKQVRHMGFGITSSNDFWNNDYFDPTLWNDDKPQKYKGYCTDIFFNETIKWIKEQKEKKKPFFAYLPTNAPHWPFWVAAKYENLFPQYEKRLAAFYGMIVNIDDNVKKLDDFLKKEGLYEDTIIVYMTDNGSAMGSKVYNAGMRDGKSSYYDGGHRVPCFIRWPGGKLEPREISSLTQVQDILPTLTSLCDLQSDLGDLDGADLSQALANGDKIPDRMLVVEAGLRGGNPSPDKNVVMWKKWRLVHGGKELYDLSKDPGQQKNIVADFPDIAKKMRDYYFKWTKEHGFDPDKYVPVIIDPTYQNPIELSCSDWIKVWCDTAIAVRKGRDKSHWNLEFRQSGRYKITLRRWPHDSGLKLRDGAAKAVMERGELVAGSSLPIDKVSLKLPSFNIKLQKNLSHDADQAVFLVDIPKGKSIMEALFLNKKDKALCGAFIAEVEKID